LRQYQTSVLDLIQAFLLRHELRLDSEDIKTLLVQGRFLLLLDGLNELPTVAGRELETFEQTYRQTAMIFTSRDVGRSLGNIKTLEMQPLNEVQMRQFVCTCLPESGEEMLRQLGSRLRELGQTPLLLSMVCSVYAELGRVPTNLGAAFRAFAEIYDNQLKANVPTYQESQYWWSQLLKHLAFKMLQGESLTEPYLTISKPEAERVLRDFLQGKVAYPDDCAVRWLEDLLKYHLLQRGTDNRIEFRHQLIQEYYAAEYLWERLADISNEPLTWEYLNYLKWTEPLALMLALVEDEAQVVRVVNLALEVDLRLGARLAGEVQPRFQEQTVGLVIQKDLHPLLKIELLATTRSDSAVPSLLQALNHKDNWGSYTAVEALGYIGSQAAVDALTQAFYHEDRYGRSAAVYELKKIGNQAAVDALIKALSHQDNILCLNAVEALGTIGNPAAVDALTQALNHEYSEIPREAVKALSEIGNSAAVKALKQAFLNTKNSKIRCEAAEALHRIWNPQIERESTTIRDSKLSAMFTFDSDKYLKNKGVIYDPEEVNQLIPALKHEDGRVRMIAADKLGKIGNSRAVIPLIQALEDEDYMVGLAATTALGEIGDELAIPALSRTLYHEDPDFCRAAVEALGKIGTQAAVAALIQSLDNEISSFGEDAAYELGEIASFEILPELTERLGKTSLGKTRRINVFYTIVRIQERCKSYNYAIATSAPPQEQTTADPLSHSLNTLNQTLKTMSETPKYDFSGASFTSFGSVTGDIKGDNIIGIQHKYAPEQKQNLAEVAAEIQQLLDQLERNNPTTTEAELIVNQAIERQPMLKEPQVIEQVIQSTPILKKRLRSAGKAAYIETVKVFLPPLGVAIEAINAWNNPED
jgi:HEAT repeat protein